MEHAKNTLLTLAREALALEVEEAREAGALGFMARALVQATMPHSKSDIPYFERANGALTLTIMAPPKTGLPYGALPRILMAWITTEACRTKDREILLGDSLSAFMRELGMMPTGGRWGSITRLRNQAHRLFSSTISLDYRDERRLAGQGFRIADCHVLWWDHKNPEQKDLFNSLVRLSEPFFREIVDRPVPIDTRALKALSHTPLGIDIYVWLTYRMSYLRRQTMIPWEALQLQFGADYAATRQFKFEFNKRLKQVLTVYPTAKVQPSAEGLILRPSPTHVPRLTSL
jgi:hypothetical protein